MNKIKKNQILIVALFVFTAFINFLRINQINAIPSSISHDEIYYATQAKTIAISGKDPSGQWQPHFFTPANELFAELPGLIISIGFLIFPNNPILASRFVFLIVGFLLPFVLASFTYLLFKKKSLSVVVFLITNVNPWFFQLSRLSFDAYLSVFFYLCGMVLLLKEKSFYLIASMLFFILGFYQYQGLKIIFLPIILISLSYLFLKNYQEKNNFFINLKKQKQLIIYCLIAVVFFITHLIRLNYQSAGKRLNDLIFFQDEHLSAQVNLLRQQAIENNFEKIFINKYTVLTKELLSKYFASFNLELLFIKGESIRNPFSVWSMGLFYPVDLIFLLFGFFNLGRIATQKQKKLAIIYLLLLLLIAPLPTAINANDTWVMFRSAFQFPILLILISLGIDYLFLIKSKLIKTLLLVIFSFIYFLNASGFFYEYFFRYPIYATKDKYFAERVLSNYINRQDKQRNFVILVDETEFVYESIITFNSLINKQNLQKINSSFLNKVYEIDNIKVETKCFDPNKIDRQTTYVVYQTTVLCNEENNDQLNNYEQLVIPSLLDSGSIFKIYNDDFCKYYDLPRFVNLRKNLFNLEKLTDDVFCKNFIIRYQ